MGVRLDKTYNGQGPNGGACDGKEQGERYFRCDAGFGAFVPLATAGGASSMTAMIAGRRRRGRRAGRLRRRGGGATTAGCFSRRSARGSTRSRTASGGVGCHYDIMLIWMTYGYVTVGAASPAHCESTTMHTSRIIHCIALRSIPFHSIPSHSIPFHSIPFHSVPFHSVPSRTASRVVCGAVS